MSKINHTLILTYGFLTKSPTHPDRVGFLSCFCCKWHKVDRAIQKYYKSQKVRYKIFSLLSLQSRSLIHGDLSQWGKISNYSKKSWALSLVTQTSVQGSCLHLTLHYDYKLRRERLQGEKASFKVWRYKEWGITSCESFHSTCAACSLRRIRGVD